MERLDTQVAHDAHQTRWSVDARVRMNHKDDLQSNCARCCRRKNITRKYRKSTLATNVTLFGFLGGNMHCPLSTRFPSQCRFISYHRALTSLNFGLGLGQNHAAIDLTSSHRGSREKRNIVQARSHCEGLLSETELDLVSFASLYCVQSRSHCTLLSRTNTL